MVIGNSIRPLNRFWHLPEPANGTNAWVTRRRNVISPQQVDDELKFLASSRRQGLRIGNAMSHSGSSALRTALPNRHRILVEERNRRA